ncbi:MAG TPA: hypothetical protein DCG42_07500 [Maribacter sp.]|uniref:hypothetical protein n=1 Tax=unclassified Maribacter TaxID=2615042 RepID=UPI000EBB74CB|nr:MULTISPECIES: hypothetical protein [unclassified Maribacter]HAF77153.1 hypothetical protein [Maribacter sp.]|tara:strand:+ start:46585 stop:47199 length:615 start_codon:yes stop_codon:yes gene_type:complete
MNAKWCVSTLFIILALLGLCQEQKKASNQQISLEFADVELASNTAHDEILAVITKKLQVLGVDTIEVIENDETQLSIRYYSDIDAESVKKFLSQEGRFLANEDEIPTEDDSDGLPGQYNLVVLDLHQHTDNGYQIKATLVAGQDHNFDSKVIPVVPALTNKFTLEFNATVELALKINSKVAIVANNTSHQIPEVRAGPTWIRNS